MGGNEFEAGGGSARLRAVVLDGYTLNPGDLSWSWLKELCETEVFERTVSSAETEDQVALIAGRIGEAEIVFTNKTPLSRAVLDRCPRVRYIGVLATGYNVVDIGTATIKGIAVTNIPTYGTAAVAQFTFALLLELCHRIGDHDASVKRGEWTRGADFCYWLHPLVELEGKTMGIVGFGRIGRTVARIARSFGMRVLAHDAGLPSGAEVEGCGMVPLDALLGESDVVSLHCPLTDSNRGMVNAASIGGMKDGAKLINTSRGPLVAERDLAAALVSGKLSGAAVDVVSTEPIAEDNPLLTAPNCIITPHIAWAPLEARSRLMSIAEDNLRSFLSGNPINVVSSR